MTRTILDQLLLKTAISDEKMLLKRVSTAPSLRVAFERLRVWYSSLVATSRYLCIDVNSSLRAATVTASAVAGCLGSGENDSGRLDLTVRNDGDEAVDIDVVVRGDDGTLYAEETDRIDPGVARAFEVTVDATGRHEVVVTGGDWGRATRVGRSGLRPVRRNGRRRRRDRLDCGRVRRHAVAQGSGKLLTVTAKTSGRDGRVRGNRRDRTRAERGVRRVDERRCVHARVASDDDYEDLIARTTSGIDGEPASGVDWFWDEIVDYLDIDFYTEYDAVRDDSGGPQFTDWYPGGEINVAHNVVDRHAAVDSPNRNRVALIWEGEPGDIREVTFHELARQTNRVANYLESVGIETGDTVGLYMPMVPEVVSILYGCLKVGAIAVPIFSGFGTEATATRIADAEPSVLFTGDGFYRRGSEVRLKATADEAIEAAGHVDDVVVYDRLGATPEGDAADPVPWNPDRDVTWTEAIESRSVDYETKRLPSDQESMLLYSSGTTGEPKGIVHTHAGVLTQCAKEIHFGFDQKPGRPVLGLRHRLDDGAVDADREPRVRRDGGDVRGCTRPPGAGPLLGDDRPTRNYAVRHLADRDPGAPQARRRMGRGPRSPHSESWARPASRGIPNRGAGSTTRSAAATARSSTSLAARRSAAASSCQCRTSR